jgi:uncharacterized protein YfdQ (DUF2303 family)
MTLDPTDPGQLLDSRNGIAAALEYAEAHTLDDEIDLGDHRTLIRRRPGEIWEVHDTYPSDTPRRSAGVVAVHDADSFIDAVAHRATYGNAIGAEVTIYADAKACALVAVLNDDTPNLPNWRDYQVTLYLARTEEWLAWVHGQGLGGQQRFAERIEEGLREIVEPAGAEMLELAQTLHVNVGVKCKSGHRLANGETQFTYEEDVQASAGRTGALSIPNEFRLGIAPFIGTSLYDVTARLRFKPPRGGDLQIGYMLDRPEAVERDAFADIVAKVRSSTVLDDVLFLQGPAPAHARGGR